MKLISTTDFVLETSNKKLDFDNTNLYEFSYDNLHKIYKYANFLKKPLELGMFVPCDEDGNVLRKPKKSQWYEYDLKKYQEAEERVLFKGFEVEDKTPNTIWLGVNNEKGNDKHFNVQYSFIEKRFMYSFTEYKTIEDLIPCGLELTESGIKEIGL